MQYADRADAGRTLATSLAGFADRSDVIVLGLPRGGVPVAAEVARALHAPLDVFLVRKLGVPGNPELAMGAIAEGGVEVLNAPLLAQLDLPEDEVRQAAADQRVELDRQGRTFRGTRPAPDLAGRVVILVDDGLATGATMDAAVTAARHLTPARVIVAVPVGARDACARLSRIADEVVCPYTPHWFQAVGQWYARFDQTTDEEVQALLAQSA